MPAMDSRWPTSLAEWTVKDSALLREYSSNAALYMPGGRAPRAGDRLASPALAASFERLANQGPRDGFYEGETAARICQALGDLG